ncbi:MAG: OmpA family protein [Planctomycetaceae bacterium]|nr:OmpA family protein [Planctomycetaceae bacterium]
MEPDKPDTTESSEWLITYGDLMTLLLCLFVMLYALSTLQETRFQSATESLRGAFGIFGGQPLNVGTVPKASGQNIGGIILFDWGCDELSEAAKQELNEVYRQLLGVPGEVQIIGRAEWGEPSAYRRELDLAYSRAIAVWDHLVSLGMSRERCQIVQQTGEAEGSFVEIRSVR